MKQKIKRFTIDEFAFYLAYGLFLIAGILSTSFYYKYYIGRPYQLIIFLILLLLLFKEIYANKLTKNGLISLITSIILFFLVNFWGSTSFAAMFLIIWSARNLQFRNIAKFTLVVSSFLFLFIIFSAYAGIIENYHALSLLRSRYYLGFRYALYGPSILYNIFTLFVYVRKNKFRWIEFLLLMIVNYFIYSQTDSRLSFYLGSMVLVSGMVFKYFPQILDKRKAICFFMICSFYFSAALSLGLTIAYDSSVLWMNNLNTFLGRRLALGQVSILNYGITWFGENIEFYGFGLDVNGKVNANALTNYNYVDSGYLNLLQRYGAVVLSICLIVLTFTMVRCYRKKNYHLLVLLTFVALHAIIDDLVIYLYNNTLWFVVAAKIENFRQVRKEEIAIKKIC